MRRRAWFAAVIFSACLAVLFAALGWASWKITALERAQIDAARKAALEENVRLALWRIDSSLASLVAQENARPYFAYAPFYAAERAYNAMFAQWHKGDVQIPSNLLAFSSPNVRIHFQLDPTGALSSPQAPKGNMRDLAESMYVTTARVQAATSTLDELRRSVDWKELRTRLPQANAFVCPSDDACDVVPPGPAPTNVGARQVERAASEFKRRAEWNAQNYSQSKQAETQVPKSVREGWMRAEWAGDKLLLVRRVLIDDREYLQGCWLDWPAIQTTALALVNDLLPKASLRPVPDSTKASTMLRLATLPVAIEPGNTRADVEVDPLPVRWSLIFAWAGAVLAAVAVGSVVVGLIALGERRATFVSAVTHELRTPLTTFRLYADMLERGMVPAPEKQREYFGAMRKEADRLGHLVDNVLAFSRLEHGSAVEPTEPCSLRAILDQCWPRLLERARTAGVQLNLLGEELARNIAVRGKTIVVEQILFNLIDNGCKYGRSEIAIIDVSIHAEEKCARIVVRDFGAGVDPKLAGRLFRPFSKSAESAARSQPGVGLGLALCRRLARSMGGDLNRIECEGAGAAFEFRFPIV